MTSLQKQARVASVIVLVFAILNSFSCFAVFGDSLNTLENQTLYFQSAHDPTYYVFWTMNLSTPSGLGTSQDANITTFVSPPLAQEFMFQGVTTMVYHGETPSGSGTFTMYVSLWHYDNNTGTWINIGSNTKQLDFGSTVDSVPISTTASKLQEGERLFASITICNNLSQPLKMYWGNSTYPSHISYEGTAVFIPELPSFLILQLFMIATVLTVIVFRRKHSSY